MDATMTVDPKAHDEAEAAMHEELAQVQHQLVSVTDAIHREAGDKRLNRWTRSERWAMTDAQALAAVSRIADAHPAGHAIHDGSAINLLRRQAAAVARIEQLRSDIGEAEAIYRQHNWLRFFKVTSSDGHIHNTLYCKSYQRNTTLAWLPSLSGTSVEQAVAEHQEGLCSICFPDAPVAWYEKRDQAERDARAAERAAREDTKAMKNLAGDEQFRDGNVWGRRSQGDWVKTVFRALEVIRDEVAGRDQWGRGPASNHAELVRAAEMAKTVLLAREARRPGSGADQAKISKTITSAVAKARREGCNLDKDGNVIA
jgi:hypothetical protein